MPRPGQPQIPEQLRNLRAWCAWRLEKRDGKTRKVPVHPDGRNFSTRVDTPYLLEEVENVATGVGLVLTDGVTVDGRTLVAFDCDACRDPDTGAIADWARDVMVNHGSTYAEITPSGQGIRVLALVDQHPGREFHKVRSMDPAPNTTKHPEIETFGLGRACYVTVSGDHLPGSSAQLEAVPSLRWFTTQHPVAVVGDDSTTPELPAGDGTAPTVDDLERVIRTHPEAALLAEGKWDEVVPDESASEGYWRLVQHAFRAARGHGETAVEWLLDRTAYGAGTVDSAEPDRYMRESWVATEVARVHSKAPRSSASVFDAPYTPSAHMPTEANAAQIAQQRAQDDAAADDALVMQADDWVEHEGARDWLVDDLLPTDGLASFFGEPGQGKTPVVLRLAIATAAGWPTFFGLDMDFHGPVVYFVGEDGAGVRDRYLAQRQRMRAEALEKLLDVDFDQRLPLYFTTQPGQITDRANVDKFIRAILKATGGVMPRLVVVDTLARNFGDGNESATQDMQAFVNGCARLSEKLGQMQDDKALVVCTHHPSKGDGSTGRGSGILKGALDAEVRVELVHRKMIKATPTKLKGAPPPDEPFVGSLVQVAEGLGFKKNGKPRTAITLDDAPPDPAAAFDDVPPDAEALRVLEAIGAAGGPVSRSRLATAARVTDKVLRNKITKLTNMGAIDVQRGPSDTSPATYLLLAQGSTLISVWSSNLALFEGPSVKQRCKVPSEGQEGQDSHNPVE